MFPRIAPWIQWMTLWIPPLIFNGFSGEQIALWKSLRGFSFCGFSGPWISLWISSWIFSVDFPNIKNSLFPITLSSKKTTH